MLLIYVSGYVDYAGYFLWVFIASTFMTIRMWVCFVRSSRLCITVIIPFPNTSVTVFADNCMFLKVWKACVNLKKFHFILYNRFTILPTLPSKSVFTRTFSAICSCKRASSQLQCWSLYFHSKAGTADLPSSGLKPVSCKYDPVAKIGVENSPLVTLRDWY
jgi:hypothetical protein